MTFKNKYVLWANFFLLFWTISVSECGISDCKGRSYNNESLYCVCNAEYCDDGEIIPDKLVHDTNSYLHYMSSISGERLERVEPSNFIHHKLFVSPYDNRTAQFDIDICTKYQEIYGFGGAITDSVAINLNSLKKKTRNKLLRQYFGKKGIGYTFIRVPVAGTDFSTRRYTYDDVVNDTKLENFSLLDEDDYKIYYIKLAQKMSPKPVRIVTASWSSPEWMKELRFPVRGHTRLKKEYYQLYADYIVKFLDEYKKRGINFWAISPQNEPQDGVMMYYGFNSLGWTGDELKIWIRDYFGPTLHSKSHSDIKILLLDDERRTLPTTGVNLMSDERIQQMISGIALHGYFQTGFLGQPFVLSDTHSLFPDKFLLYTEASIMHSPDDPPVILGNWERGEYYATSIMEILNYWVVGWIDWNLALNFEGGPTWAGNTLDASIIVNSTADEFYKQPMFYAIAHFSKFLPPGSVHVKLKTISDDEREIENVAFLRPDNFVVIILLNRGDLNKTAVIYVRERGKISVKIPAHSIHTLLYRVNVESLSDCEFHNIYAEYNTASCEKSYHIAIYLICVFVYFQWWYYS